MRVALRSRFHGLLSSRTVLLGVTGRRSGTRYEICVGYAPVRDDGLDVLVSDASNRTWWRNFVDGGPIDVVLRGESRHGRAVAHRAPSAEFKEIADRSMPAIVGERGMSRFFAVDAFDPAIGLTDDDLTRLAGFAVAVHIDLDDEPASA